MIKIMQIGMGPLGIKIAKMIGERNGVETILAIDQDPKLAGQDIGDLSNGAPSGIQITTDISAAIARNRPDIAVVTTVSDMERITPLLEELIRRRIPVVSTCEELSHPWDEAPELAHRIDQAAKTAGVAVLGTGVNPGFLMDALPTFLTAVCQDVRFIRVQRYQDARFRRIPFQQKIGAGLSPQDFERKKQAGTLRHVGLTESMQMIARRMGWPLDRTEDIITPVIASSDIRTEAMHIPAGHAMGVRQVGSAYVNGELRIELVFQAAVGEPESYDEVQIDGTPRIHSRIAGGVNGDIATGAITINALPRVLEAQPGLRTMMDIAPVSFFS